MSDATSPETRAVHADFHANAIAFRVSREQLLLYGHAQATPEENAAHHEEQRRWHAESVTDWEVYDAARGALDALEDPVERCMLTLHSSATVDEPECRGCDQGYGDSGPPAWPCSTVRAIADQHGIRLPTSIDTRPSAECTPTDYPTKPWRMTDLFPSSFVTFDPAVFNGSPVAE